MNNTYLNFLSNRELNATQMSGLTTEFKGSRPLIKMLTGVEIYIRPCITSRVTIIYGAQQQKYAEKDYNKFENVKTSASYTFLLANNQKL